MPESALSECVRKLEANLDKETALYEKLANVARETAVALERNDSDAVTELLTTKRGMIAELRNTAETTDALREELADYEEVPQDMQDRASDALKRARSALETLLVLERANGESFRAVTDTTRAELADIARGRRLLDGYRAARDTTPLFMDKRR
jgi:DNA-binding XRE family transcriptional regulator